MYILVFIIGFLLSGAWFGCLLFINAYIRKKELLFLNKYAPFISALLPTVIISVLLKEHPFHFSSILNFRLWCIAFFTVGATCLIILIGKKERPLDDDGSLAAKCIEASMMEIPQRIMMQTFCCGLLVLFKMQAHYGIIINALIWCADIIFQAVMLKQRNYTILFIELLASFIFSLGIGYVFFVSNCFVIPMLSHASERYVTQKIGGIIHGI